MSDGPLPTYLSDHLAGSIAALKLLAYLAEAAPSLDDRQFFTALHRDVTEDQQVLEQLLHRVGGGESPFRKAGAWLTEKLGEVKLRLDEATKGGLLQLEALEALALGIQGKLGLWVALEAVSAQVEAVQSLDLVHLQQRARDQHAQVELRRVLAAREAFGGPASYLSVHNTPRRVGPE